MPLVKQQAETKKMVVLETNERWGSVALFGGETLCWAEVLEPPIRSAQSLLPVLERGLKTLTWSPRAIDTVAVVCGPGSFTGLRIAVTAAKCLAYAASARVVAVDTFAATAAAVGDCGTPLDIVIDAQRGEAVVQRWIGSTNALVPRESPQLVRIETLIASWKQETSSEIETSLAVVGTVFPRWTPAVEAACGDRVRVVTEFPVPLAVAAGSVAIARLKCGHDATTDLWNLVPTYTRDPAAVERLHEIRP